MQSLSNAASSFFLITTSVLTLTLFIQHRAVKRAKAKVKEYQFLNSELLSNEGLFRQKLLDIHNAVEKEDGGIKLRMAQNLQLAHTVQKHAPDLVATRPGIVRALEANQRFLETLYDATDLSRDSWTCDEVFHLRNSLARDNLAKAYTSVGIEN